MLPGRCARATIREIPPDPARTAKRIARSARVRFDAVPVRRALKASPVPGLLAVGDLSYGGQVIVDGALDRDSVYYGIGVGEDITFDLALIARYGLTAHAFDPVPRAATFAAQAAAHEPRHVFHPYAVWNRDEPLTFHEPVDPGYVSQSAVNLHGTPPSFTAPGRSLPSLMRELGHERIDLLKVSAEGAEFAILDHLVESGLRPAVVCSEFSLPVAPAGVRRVAADMAGAGYRLVSRTIRPGGWKVTWQTV